jgi:DNA-binding phage protein
MTRTSTYAKDLRQLGAQFNALAALADADPAKAMTELGELINNSSDSALLARLRTVRRQVTHAAVDAAGGKAALARALGVSETTVYRALGDERRVRKPPKPKAP